MLLRDRDYAKVDDVKSFLSNYNEKTNETLRTASTKTLSSKNRFFKFVYLRCHHNTRYHNTMNSKEVVESKPSKRFKNTDCPFTMVLEFIRNPESELNCVLEMEWIHNHPTKSLQALSFKDINPNVKTEMFTLFDKSFTPGLAYKEFWRRTKESCTNNELNLLTMIADRSIIPRRTDFNKLYT